MSTDLVVPGAEGAGDGASLRITAENVPQFLTLIRAMVEHSGRTRGQIVTVSGLPRSTVYHFTSEKNTSLPKSRDQVRALARACKLDDTQVGEVLKIWDRLAREEYETGRTPEQEPKPLTFTVSNSESITVEDGKFVLEQRVVRSDSQWKRRLNVLTSGAMLVLVVMLIGVLATGLKARDQAETARFEAEQRAAMVANALVAGGGANTSWSGLPSGGTWYKLAEFQPVRGTTESLATREVVVQGLSYPTALVGYTRDGAQSVTYALSKSCVAFSAMAGVDDRSQGASTRLHAMVDKRTVTTVYRGAGDVPVSVNFSVRGASELSLQVDQTPMGLGTIGAWIGAQVYCTAPPGQVI